MPRDGASANRMLMAILLGQIAFGLLAMTICLPSMPQWASLFKASQASVQLTFSAYVLTFGAFQLIYGPLSDRHGRRRVLLVGLSLACAGSVMAMLSPDLATLTAARMLQGAGSAAGTVVARAMVQDLYQGPERTRVMAYIGMAMGLCPPLATIVGGQLHVHFGWQAGFAAMTLLGIVLFIAAWFGLPGHRPGPASDTHWLQDMLHAYRRLAREPAFLLYVSILGTLYATFFAFLGSAPLVLSSYGVGPDGVGWYIMIVTVAYIAGNYITSRQIRRQGERRMMAVGQAGTLAGISLMLSLGMAGVNSPLAFAVPLMLLGLGHGFLMPTALAGTIGVVPALAGAAAAVAGLAQQVMGALGGYAAGLVPHEGPMNLGWLMLGFSLCTLVSQIMLHRR